MNKLIIALLTTCIGLYGQEDTSALFTQLGSSSSPKEKNDIRLQIIDIYLDNDEKSDSVLSLNKQVEDFAIITGDQQLLAESFTRYARLYYYSSDYEKAIFYGKKGDSIFTEIDKPHDAALLKVKLGNTYQVLGQNKEALDYFNEARDHLEENDLISFHQGLGTVYSQLYDIEKSIYHYNQAYNKAIETQQLSYLYNIYTGMAIVYDKDGDFEKTIDYMEKALAESVDNNNYFGQMVSYHNLGLKHFLIQDYSKAIAYYNKALELKDKTTNKDLLGATYFNYAEALLYDGSLSTSKRYIQKADSLYSALGLNLRAHNILGIRAAIANKEGNLKEAIELWQQALVISKENEAIGEMSKNYLALSNAYEAMENHKASLTAFKKYETLKDSITSINKTKEIELLKTQFDITQYEQEIENQNNKLALIEAKASESNYRNVLLGVMVLGLLFFIYRQRKINKAKAEAFLQEKEIVNLKQERLERKMQFKNTRIAEYAIHIDQRNSFLEECKTKIKDIRKLTHEKNITNRLNDLHTYIRENIEVNKEQVEFDKDPKHKGDSFKFKLEERYPKLTNKEVLVCKLILLNMSSKKIAQELDISSQSVNNYRTSIRNKLGLNRQENLKRVLDHI